MGGFGVQSHAASCKDVTHSSISEPRPHNVNRVWMRMQKSVCGTNRIERDAKSASNIVSVSGWQNPRNRIRSEHTFDEMMNGTISAECEHEAETVVCCAGCLLPQIIRALRLRKFSRMALPRKIAGDHRTSFWAACAACRWVHDNKRVSFHAYIPEYR